MNNYTIFLKTFDINKILTFLALDKRINTLISNQSDWLKMYKTELLTNKIFKKLYMNKEQRNNSLNKIIKALLNIYHNIKYD